MAIIAIFAGLVKGRREEWLVRELRASAVIFSSEVGMYDAANKHIACPVS